MLLKDTIIELCALSAPSGFEDRAYSKISGLLLPYVDEIKTDPMGNLIALRRCGHPNAKKLMLDAHMDEIGMIVTGYDKGFLRFANLGGIDPRMLPAREIKLLTNPPLYGVIDTMPPHALSAEDMDKSIDADKLFIDVGLSEEETKRRIPLGTPAVFAGGVSCLTDNILCGKALDDRACAAIILKTMEELSSKTIDVDIYCLISTQEELGMRGAITGTYGINPDYAVAIDVTHAATPDSKKGETMEMRKGAAIVAMCIEGRQISSDELAQFLADRANSGAGDVAFVIGSSHGLSDEVKKAAALRFSMGRITMPHQLARLVLTEQIYRACTINAGMKYHK